MARRKTLHGFVLAEAAACSRMKPKAVTETRFGKTPAGQLLYDLAFTNLSEKYLAGKHRKPIAEIRRLRAGPEIKKLRKKNRLRETT